MLSSENLLKEPTLERLRKEELIQLIRKTNLYEYLQVSHQCLSRKLAVESRVKFITRIGSPQGKKRPDYLRPWTDFIDLQKEMFSRLFTTYPWDSGSRVFTSSITSEDVWSDILKGEGSSEMDRNFVMKPILANPVEKILNHLKTVEGVCREFCLDPISSLQGCDAGVWIYGRHRYRIRGTRERFVFLRVDPESPETVFYHLVEPTADVAEQIANFPEDEYLHRTAVSQLLAFTLQALESEHARDISDRQASIANAKRKLSTWGQNFSDRVTSLFEEQCKNVTASPYMPTPYLLERKGGGSRKPRPQPPVDYRRFISNANGEDDDETFYPDTPIPAPRKSIETSRLSGRGPRDGRQQLRAYCTHVCLLGLVRGAPLDMNCPNVISTDPQGMLIT
ncbi:hypothetical protein GP486_007644, partial [Trichoglossum hirsutum]